MNAVGYYHNENVMSGPSLTASDILLDIILIILDLPEYHKDIRTAYRVFRQ